MSSRVLPTSALNTTPRRLLSIPFPSRSLGRPKQPPALLRLYSSFSSSSRSCLLHTSARARSVVSSSLSSSPAGPQSRTFTPTAIMAPSRTLHVSSQRLQQQEAASDVGSGVPYSTPESYPTTHARLARVEDTCYFVDNKFVKSTTDRFIDLADPATNFPVTRVPQNTEAELAAAVASAERAFPGWRDTSVMRRQQVMFNLVALIKDHWDRLAASITLEQGKTFDDAKADVLRGLQVAEAACAAPEYLKGEVLEVARDMETRTYREPLGVVAAICPFNFPAMIPLWCIPIATVTGNTLVLKPSERDPGAAMILAELCAKADFPPGVVNVVHGAHDTVNFLLDAPAIKAISFVGSNRAGEYIFSRGSANGKRVQANLGAKNHAVVLPDANKNQFLNAVMGAAFGAAGQRCMALSTLVTVGDETRAWLAELAERSAKLTVNAGFEPGADLGPVTSPQSKARIESIIASAEAEGATVLLDGRGARPDGYPDGNWVGPTIITGVTARMRCYREEIFGPVLVCLHADTLEEAVALVNANEYGNGAAVFTRSGAAAELFRRTVEAGQVGLNVPIPVPLPMFSFTGNKRSVAGGGASTFYGRPGVAFYTQLKTVTAMWAAADAVASARADVAMPTMR